MLHHCCRCNWLKILFRSNFCQRKLSSSHFNCRLFGSDLVPSTSQWIEIKEEDLPSKTILSLEEVRHVENLALVQYEDLNFEKTILEDAIRFADILLTVNTDDVEPLYTVLEDESLYLREDIVTEGGSAENILKNAQSVMEDYFVAPPGNIALSDSEHKSN
ncbi:unnamed protein product [Clavelina lepadiformis]|uniref:Glutamyl-tRNA(Gln) amidotransferase subunit C, mitochondrial n=1 Tax=Clavelina lepadiformis TaxID=159417 RepID=A0ABP0FNU9_CLALP